MPGDEPGTFRDAATGATYALPSSFGPSFDMGPVTREEFERLAAKVSFFADTITRQKPDAVASMIEALTPEGDADGPRRH